MVTHRFHRSIKRLCSLCRRSLPPALCLFTLTLSSCATGPRHPAPDPNRPNDQNAAPDALTPQRRALSQLTDQILLALATRNFQQLPKFLAPPQNRFTGPQIALALLGPDAPTILLDRWDPENTDILFDQQALWATAKIPVHYRLQPNHPPRTFPFTFQFIRAAGSDDWKLYLP